MSTRCRDKKIPMARCSECDHDLQVHMTAKNQSNGLVFCSNYGCRFHGVPHPMPSFRSLMRN